MSTAEDETKPNKSNIELHNENKALMQESENLKQEVLFQENLIAQIYDDLDSAQNTLSSLIGKIGTIKQRTKNNINASPLKQAAQRKFADEQAKAEEVARKKTSKSK